MTRTLWVTALLAAVALLVAQIAAVLAFLFVPAPSPNTLGPQGPLDEALGILAGPGSILGVVLAIVSGVRGQRFAERRRQGRWSATIAGSGVLAVAALALEAFVLLGSGRNAVHPFSVFIVIPIAVIAYGRSAAR